MKENNIKPPDYNNNTRNREGAPGIISCQRQTDDSLTVSIFGKVQYPTWQPWMVIGWLQQHTLFTWPIRIPVMVVPGITKLHTQTWNYKRIKRQPSWNISQVLFLTLMLLLYIGRTPQSRGSVTIEQLYKFAIFTYIEMFPVMVPVAIKSREGWVSSENKTSSNAPLFKHEEPPLTLLDDDDVKLMQWGGTEAGSPTSEIPAMF